MTVVAGTNPTDVRATDRSDPIVELRVHGVGGSTAAALLDAEGDSRVVQVAGGPSSAFYARRTRRDVEGYVWGPLTTQSLLQPLWILLLPFTLLNVSGWLHRSEPDSALARRIRAVVIALGYTLTVSWSLWVCVIVVDVVAYQWGAGVAPGWAGPGVRIVAGAILIFAVLGAVVLTARHNTGDFEEFDPPERQWLRPGDDPARRLSDPGFWTQGRAVRLRLDMHTFAMALTAGVLVLLAARSAAAQAGGPIQPLGTGHLLVPLLQLQVALLLLLAILSLIDLASQRSHGATHALGPFGGATTAVGITHTGFAGLARYLSERLPGARSEPGMAEQVLGDVLGLATLVAMIVVVAWLMWFRMVARAGDEPLSTAGPGEEHNGLPNAGWRRKLARHRKFSQAIGGAGWILLVPSVVFLVAGAWALATRTAGWWSVPSGWGWADLWVRNVGGYAAGDPLAWAAGPGAFLIGSAVAAGPPFLLAAVRRPSLRKGVGTLWDVLTFWPRWLHPFAVRPYSERAVPELQHRIVHHVKAGKRVLLSVHSQGSVLAAAALEGLAEVVTRRVTLVTYGCPLSQLYGRIFPAYFGPNGNFQALEKRLAGWQNYYRATDYIGQRVEGMGQNRELDDPPREPLAGTVPEDDAGWLDEVTRPAWTSFSLHSYYRQEPALRRAINQLERRQ